LGHAEIVADAAGGVVSLFVTDDHATPPADPAEAADDRLVIGKGAVPGERHEILDEASRVIVEVRTLGMARDLRLLPRREAGIEVAEHLVRLSLQLCDFRPDR